MKERQLTKEELVEQLKSIGFDRVEQTQSGTWILYYGKALHRNLGLYDEGNRPFDVEAELSLLIGSDLLFRGTNGTALDIVLKTGHDIPEFKIGDLTNVTPYFHKATEYGDDVLDAQAEPTQLMLVYKQKDFQRVPGEMYREQIIRDPKEALQAVLVLPIES